MYWWSCRHLQVHTNIKVHCQQKCSVYEPQLYLILPSSSDLGSETVKPLFGNNVHFYWTFIGLVQCTCLHWRRLVKNIGWAYQNIGAEGGKSDKCMGIPQLL